MAAIGLPQTITLAAAAFSAVMLLITLAMMRRETRISRLAPFIAIGTTVLTTWLYLVVTGADVSTSLAWGFVGFGFLIGVLQGQATKIHFRGKAIFGKRSTAYVLLWGLAYLVSVGLAQLGNAAFHAFAILGMLFGMGTALGANLNLFVRQLFLRPPRVAPVSSGDLPAAYVPTGRSKPANLPR